jgi:adenylate cyclase class IV
LYEKSNVDKTRKDSFVKHELDIKPSVSTASNNDLNERLESDNSDNKYSGVKSDNYYSKNTNDFERDPLSVRLNITDLENSDKKIDNVDLNINQNKDNEYYSDLNIDLNNVI